jgi:hypothetical protein
MLPTEEVVEALIVVVATLVVAVAREEDADAIPGASPTTPTSAMALVVAIRAAVAPTIPSRCVKCVSRPAIPLIGAGTGLRRTASLRRSTPAQQ